MWSPRAQADRNKFSALWRDILEHTECLSMWQGSVDALIIEDGVLKGVRTGEGASFFAPQVVLTNGTFLNGLMHIGRVSFEAAASPSRHRTASPSSSALSALLPTA